ncbi:MAG: hypothetical protein HOP22_05500 [Nitrospiraceae bacterium]|nr:hypothetical protein [Nitrospiraceae bacterium]
MLSTVRSQYRHILILESRSWWGSCRDRFDPARDLVLTYDLGLRREVSRMGGQAFYVDYLVDSATMEKNNFLIYEFFRTWHRDTAGQDIFVHRGIPFGFAFRIDIWTDFVFHLQSRICLETLRGLKFESVFVGTQLGIVEAILKDMAIPFSPVPIAENPGQATYYFPAFRWMDERIRNRTLKHRFRDLITAVQGFVMSRLDRLLRSRNGKPAIFIHEYYPTRTLVQRLLHNSKVRVVLAHFSWASGWGKYLSERPIPVWGTVERFQLDADRLMRMFRERRGARLLLTNGVDVTEGAYRVIEKRISAQIAETIRTLDCVIEYVKEIPISLVVLVANIGRVATLVDCVAKARGVPSYLIVNGMLTSAFLDEAKYATVINAYSTSMKEHYFRGMDNVVCLGDPRMDAYVQNVPRRLINRKAPTVTIGASGHNNTSLNSYLAVEFEFMFDVLEALRRIKHESPELRIVIKVRSNGYREQYEQFSNEYFPGLVNEIMDNVSIKDVLDRTDFFITIYSQTLFEASCMGIPCLYYKKDDEIMYPPFDGYSELVTVDTVDDLVEAFHDFQSGDKRFDAFLDKAVMEKYVGPLDGRNLERNLSFIDDLLAKGDKVMAQ